ncbi:MAG TPA: hypothetical protein VGN20_21520 [Mucilaginibacter sp.]|jgi:hypothetical protein
MKILIAGVAGFVGEISGDKSKASGLDILEKILSLNPNLSEWQSAHDQYFDDKNIELIKKSILNLN